MLKWLLSILISSKSRREKEAVGWLPQRRSNKDLGLIRIGRIAVFLSFLLTGCAQLYHLHLSDVDGKITSKGTRFVILVSETGVNLNEAGAIAKGFAQNKKSRDQVQKIQNVISLFQMGPRTGNMVFNDSFANNLVYAIREKCPNGRVTSLMSVRELRKYPVVSGEIIKIVGYCLPREAS